MRLSLTLLVVLALSRVAAADPVLSRVLTAPTAWLPPAGTTIGTAGYGRFGDGGMINLGIGLGGIAAVDIGAENDVRGCTTCGSGQPDPIWLGRAGFRLGMRQGMMGRGAPALVFGVRTTFASRGHTFGKARAAEAHLVASWVIGPTRIHAGVAALDAGYDAGDDNRLSLGPTVKPLFGFEWTPREFPRSSLMTDVMWVPRLEPDQVKLERVIGIGVRYQALSWSSIELGVRNREDEGLAGTTVLVRVNGVWDAVDRTKKTALPR